MKLISFVASDSEESTLETFCEKLQLPEDQFWENPQIFLTAFQNIGKIKGFAATKMQHLNAVMERIKSNIEVDHLKHNFFPKAAWSLSIDRYESLAKRNYDRIMYEQFHDKVFFNFLKSWPHGIKKHDVIEHILEVKDLLIKPEIAPTISWIKSEVSESIQKRIKDECDGKIMRRFRNLIKDQWDEIYSVQVRNLFKEYLYEGVYEKDLAFSVFSSWYGMNDKYSRACEYCKVTEEKINTLIKNKLIYTKRNYARGRSMEVDKRDPAKPYVLSNLVMSCYWCNNAKTDEFTEEEFKSIAAQIKTVWDARLKTILDK